MTAALLLWFLWKTDHGHFSVTTWTNAGIGACIVAWNCCFSDWRARIILSKMDSMQSSEAQCQSDQDATATVHRLGSR
jgi:hypothetical protein